MPYLVVEVKFEWSLYASKRATYCFPRIGLIFLRLLVSISIIRFMAIQIGHTKFSNKILHVMALIRPCSIEENHYSTSDQTQKKRIQFFTHS